MSKKASKIKIIIIDKESNFKLRLPGMPFWLISSFISFGMLLKPLLLRKADLDHNARLLINKLDKKTVKEFINEFKMYGPFDLVDVSTGDGTKVKISIL